MIGPFKGKYYFLSNFSDSYVHFEREDYPTVENAFQAAKMLDKEKRKAFTNCPPGDAKRMGRRVRLRKDWEEVKYNIMLELLRSKFQNPTLRSKLIDTGHEELVEVNTWNDQIWGVCNGEGKNLLGKAIMTVRSELKGE